MLIRFLLLLLHLFMSIPFILANTCTRYWRRLHHSTYCSVDIDYNGSFSIFTSMTLSCALISEKFAESYIVEGKNLELKR